MGVPGLAKGKKNAKRRGAWVVFQDESGFSLLPPVRATWAPRGETPVLTHRFSWKRLSMSAAMGFRPDGSDATVMFEFLAGSYNDDTIIEFLEHLREHMNAKVTLIWDGLPSHRSKKMKAWIKTQRCWLVVEQLPGYAPDLNPVEGMWGNLKGRELANLCVDTISDAEVHVDQGLNRIAADSDLCFAFLKRWGLSL